MKRLLIVLFCFAGMTYAQLPVMERLGDWMADSITLRGSLQGMALYEDRAVLLRHNGQCLILDMNGEQLLAHYQLSGNHSHCNNASFSNTIMEGDKYPLLYVSECFGDKTCFVTRISDTGSTIVQRIYYVSGCFPVAQDWCLDRENGFLYAFGGKKYGTMYLKKFRIPELGDSVVKLYDKDVLKTIAFDCVKVAQGSKIEGGFAYLPDGEDEGGYWLHVLDLETGKEVRRIDLNTIGLEPEGIDIKDGWIYVGFNTKEKKDNKIYKFEQ